MHYCTDLTSSLKVAYASKHTLALIGDILIHELHDACPNSFFY